VTIPARNVVPKPLQKPHPPMWVACSKRETIAMAARNGLGALTFAFIDAPEAADYVETYYSTLEAEGVPIGFAVNPNLAVVTGLLCHPDEQHAIDVGIDGPHFFAYSLAHYYIFGTHRPSRTQLWEEFQANREFAGMSKALIKAEGQPLTAKVRAADALEASGDADDFKKAAESQRGAIGTPDQIRDFVRTYEEVGVDQLIFNLSTGVTPHDEVCASLELFARDVLPEFKEREAAAQAAKERRLAPVLEKVMSRKVADETPDPEVEITASAAI
jgi:alkanesulfonate monooxygenase SsuD/methylene tetrahydromethanopterin reductase-like flavin-dependent oxidoreductase (luciferase family)